VSTEHNHLAVPEQLLDALAERVATRVVALLDQRQPTDADPWLTVAQAAEHMAVPASRVYDLAARDDLRHGRDGRSLRFRRSWLDAYMESGR